MNQPTFNIKNNLKEMTKPHNLLILGMLLFMAAGRVPAQASSYFTFGTNDTVLLRPDNQVGNSVVIARAHFEKRLDQWQLTFSWPDGLTFIGASAGPGMDIAYLRYDLTPAVCHAPLNVSASTNTVSSHITTLGYWDFDLDHDSLKDSYGTVKWEPGDYEMFTVSIVSSNLFRSGTVTINGTLSSGNDTRGNFIEPTTFQKTVTFIVGYERGDVNGDGELTIDDVTILIDALLTDTATLDEFKLAAADFNRDGSVDISDTTDLTEYLNLTH